MQYFPFRTKFSNAESTAYKFKINLSLECGSYNAAIKPRAIAGIRRRREGQKVQIVSSLNNLQFLTFGVHCTLTDIAEAQQ